ncbi:membralin [Anthonomus grandis grandis]|uniref:membralin n=1 Tax=Anthonomus grandis grandis TaxID=2921223 RepID=UPI00216514A6|nr:membralin [Anthonomus grandis grandis]
MSGEAPGAVNPNPDPQPEAAPPPQQFNGVRPLITINRTRNHNQFRDVRDRLFHTLFYRGALAYARAFPKPLRRLIEFVFLLKAFGAFFILVYIHLSFSKTANSCLDGVVNNWPKDGVLRVEIVKNMEEGYGLEQSYMKEERVNKLGRDDMSSILGLLTTRLDLEPSTLEYGQKPTEPLTKNLEPVTIKASPPVDPDMSYPDELLNISTTSRSKHFLSDTYDFFTKSPRDPEYTMVEQTSLLPDNLTSISNPETSKTSSKSFETKIIDKGDVYIVEYALEYGFLRLSPATRARLNIPVKGVFLDPSNHQCFGDSFSRILLEEFLGYNDLLLTSVKSFAEKEQNKGYLKNVVSGEHYRFVNLWMAKSAYIPAVICMLIFTVIVSMLLRYAHHQIFVFIVDLLQMLEFNMSITFPTAPLLTVILALVGIEAIMSEFFNDTTTAFYVILIVWLADQYDAICCHTPITKRHWLKFFYLYHFVFYAYHYRFNGQYTGLSLTVHWLFIQHSMIYFFHHYELPVILHQIQFQQILLRSAQQPPVAVPPAEAVPHTVAANAIPDLRGRISQLLSVVRPSATTQTSSIAVPPVSTIATVSVATSTSTITTSSLTRTTASVGTTAQPIITSQSIQTVSTDVNTTESQTSTGLQSESVSIQTNDEGTRPPPHGGPEGPDQP